MNTIISGQEVIEECLSNLENSNNNNNDKSVNMEFIKVKFKT